MMPTYLSKSDLRELQNGIPEKSIRAGSLTEESNVAVVTIYRALGLKVPKINLKVVQSNISLTL